jgi:hypothetical protein
MTYRHVPSLFLLCNVQTGSPLLSPDLLMIGFCRGRPRLLYPLLCRGIDTVMMHRLFFHLRIFFLLAIFVFSSSVSVEKPKKWPMLSTSRHLQYQPGLLLAPYPKNAIPMVYSAGNSQRSHAHATSVKRRRQNARVNSRAGHAIVVGLNAAIMQSMLEEKRLRHAVLCRMLRLSMPLHRRLGEQQNVRRPLTHELFTAAAVGEMTHQTSRPEHS